MARLIVVFMLILSSRLNAQSEIPYGADILRITVLDAAGGVWKSFDKPPFPALKDLPMTSGTVLAYPQGRMPEIYTFADGTAAPSHWAEADVPFVFGEAGVLRHESCADLLFGQHIAKREAVGLQEGVLHQRKALGVNVCGGVR